MLVGVTAALAISTGLALKAAFKNARSATDVLEQNRKLIEIGQDQVRVSPEEVVAAERQVDAATAALEASYRPLLTPIHQVTVPPWRELVVDAGDGLRSTVPGGLGGLPRWFTNGQYMWMVLPIRNIGPGAAVFEKSAPPMLKSADQQNPPGKPNVPVMASGDIGWVAFAWRALDYLMQEPSSSERPIGDSVSFGVTLRYWDVSRSQAFTSKFDLRPIHQQETLEVVWFDVEIDALPMLQA